MEPEIPRGFLDVPQTAVTGHLLPHLDATDMLRLRHIHPVTRQWVISRGNSDVLSSIWRTSKDHFVEIDGRRNSVDDLLDMRSPNPLKYSTRYFIKNFRWDAVNDPAFSEFLEMYASKIHHLHVQRYSVCSDPNELVFYNSLVNLKRLEIDVVDMESMTPNHLTNVNAYIPLKTFGKVQELGIGRVTYGRVGRENIDRRRYIRNHFFPAFTTLKALKSPKEDIHRVEMIHLQNNPECLCLPFLKIFPFMQPGVIRWDAYKDLTTLKVLDMQSVQEPFMDTNEFVYLAVASIKCGVELRNLRATYHMIPDPDLMSFIGRLGEVPRKLAGLPPRSLLICRAASMFNIAPAMMTHPCPNLRKLTITSCNWCLHNLRDPIVPPGEFRVDWPNLEAMEMNIDCKVMGAIYFDDEDHDSLDETRVFLRYLFMEPNGRPALESLRLSFTLWQEDDVLFPTLTADIALSCKNLVRLELSGWQAGNYTYWPIWDSLTKLEEVVLGGCDGLGDEGFIGPRCRRDNRPLFLKLTRLRTLVLKAMDRMTGITDVTFTQVFKHLSLTHFEMDCDAPIMNVSIHGIRSLLDGPFAKSIQHFPFTRWTLALRSVRNRKDVIALHSKFRSSQMQALCDPEEHTPGLSCRNCARLSSLAGRRTFDKPDKMVSAIVSRREMEAESDDDDDAFKPQPPATIWEFGAGIIGSLPPRQKKYLAVMCMVGLMCAVTFCAYIILSR